MYAIRSYYVLDRKKKHDIEVVVDRIRVSESSRGRLADSVALALSLADGLVRVGNERAEGDP